VEIKKFYEQYPDELPVKDQKKKTFDKAGNSESQLNQKNHYG
jgi:hypothetical protein